MEFLVAVSRVSSFCASDMCSCFTTVHSIEGVITYLDPIPDLREGVADNTVGC